MKVCLFVNLVGAGVQLFGEQTGFSRTEALRLFLQKHLQLQVAVDQVVDSLMSPPFGGIHPKGDRIGNHCKENILRRNITKKKVVWYNTL